MSKRRIVSKPAALSDISKAKERLLCRTSPDQRSSGLQLFLQPGQTGGRSRALEGSIRAGYLRIFPSGNWMIRPIRRLVTASARLILGEQKPQLNPVRDSVGLAVQSAAPFPSARTNRSTKKRCGGQGRLTLLPLQNRFHGKDRLMRQNHE